MHGWTIVSPSVMQESELALRRLAGGLRELSAVKTDLAQHGDAALLEQQLEQLHGRWEELCTKVSGNQRDGELGGKGGKWRESEERGSRREAGEKLPPAVPLRGAMGQDQRTTGSNARSHTHTQKYKQVESGESYSHLLTSFLMTGTPGGAPATTYQSRLLVL